MPTSGLHTYSRTMTKDADLLVELGRRLKTLSRRQDKVEKMIKDTQGEILAAMERLGLISFKEQDGQRILETHGGFELQNVRIVGVQSTRHSFPLEKARKVLKEEQFAAVTGLYVDKALLEAAVSAGQITPATVLKLTDTTYTSPYPKVTLVKE